jgi:hypothetical protein
MRNAYKMLDGNPEEKRPHRGPRHRLENTTEMDL